MNAQTEMFPAVEADRAQAVLNFLLTRREKAEKALATAETNLDDIITLIGKQEHIVRTLREQAVSTPTIPDPLYAMADAEPEPEDAEVLAIDGVAVAPDGREYDTATGEVIDQEPEPADAEGVVYVDCSGLGGTLLTSDVGPHTRYGELIADYLAQAELDDDPVGYVVLDDDGQPCDPGETINRVHWHATFRVERKAWAETAA